MPMSARLLRPRQTIHPEAADWANRVRTNGGSVSGTTLSAVDRFVKAIHAAGIRNRFYRLNLFAGTGLAAALVPLFRNTSLAGAALGNTTDTNAGSTLFVSGDFSESVGLHANGTVGGTNPKYLDTGLSPDDMPTLATGHMSVWKGAGSIGVNNGGLIGSRTASQFYYLRQNNTTDAVGANWGVGVIVNSPSAETASSHVLFRRESATRGYILKNGSVITTSTSVTSPAANANDFVVFNWRETAGTVTAANGWPHAILAYSIGADMTDSQALSFYNALAAFNTAMGR